MQRISSDILIATLLLVLCGAFFVESFAIRDSAMQIVSAALWPRAAIVALAVLSMMYLVQSLRAGAAPRQRIGLRAWLGDNRNVLAVFALYGLFLVSLRSLGMLLGGALFVFLTLTAMGRRDARSHALHLAIAVVSIGAMWALFTFGLGVILPEGRVLPR